jgi:hypothetical protein
MIAPVRGRKANNKEMMSKVNEGMKDWGGKWREKAVWLSSL